MELLSDNCKVLVDELDRLLNYLHVPPEVQPTISTNKVLSIGEIDYTYCDTRTWLAEWFWKKVGI
jgi:hypothetical protein